MFSGGSDLLLNYSQGSLSSHFSGAGTDYDWHLSAGGNITHSITTSAGITSASFGISGADIPPAKSYLIDNYKWSHDNHGWEVNDDGTYNTKSNNVAKTENRILDFIIQLH